MSDFAMYEPAQHIIIISSMNKISIMLLNTLNSFTSTSSQYFEYMSTWPSTWIQEVPNSLEL